MNGDTGLPRNQPVVLPAMASAQVASWHGLMDLHDRLPSGWTLVGGQLVHLHCAERGQLPPRPTNDIDAVLDVRSNPSILLDVTTSLRDLQFEAAGISADGIQHRWVRGEAQIDVLLPDGVGQRAVSRVGATGSPTIATPGGTQALQRTQPIAIDVDGREGFVLRPDLIGALVMKAAAHTVRSDPLRDRHRSDFTVLAALVAARDFRAQNLSPKDRKRLRTMIEACRADSKLIARANGASSSLDRLERAAALLD
jgi:hypothetical protein